MGRLMQPLEEQHHYHTRHNDIRGFSADASQGQTSDHGGGDPTGGSESRHAVLLGIGRGAASPPGAEPLCYYSDSNADAIKGGGI